MGAPLFYLQVVDRDGVIVRLPGGTRLERELVSACVDQAVSKGVGLWKSEAQVKQAISEGIAEVIKGLKQQTRQLV